MSFFTQPRRRRLRLLATSLTVLLAVATTALAAHWPQMGGDAGRSGHQPVDAGGLPVVPFYAKTEDSEKNIRTSIITTAGTVSDDPDLGQRMIYGTRGTAASDRATIHHQILYDGAPVNENEPGVAIDDGAVDTDSLTGGTDANQPVGSVTPVDGSTPDGPAITFAVHNDDNQDGVTNGANGQPDPRSGSDIALAMIDQESGMLLRDRAIGPQDLPASGPQTNHTIGFTTSSSPAIGPLEDLDSDGAADDRAIFFTGHRAGTNLQPSEVPCSPGIDAESVPPMGAPRGCTVVTDVRLFRVAVKDAGTNAADFNQGTDIKAVDLVNNSSTVQTSSVALAYLDPDADGVTELYVVAPTSDGFVRTFKASDLTAGPASADLGGRVTTPAIPVNADGSIPNPAPKIIAGVDNTTQSQLVELSVTTPTTLAPADPATDRSPNVPGRPGAALAVTQLAGAGGGRVILGTQNNLYSFNADNYADVEFQDPFSGYAAGSTGFFNTVPAASGGLVYVANDRNDQMVLDEFRLEPVAPESFTPFAVEAGNEPANGDGIGQPAISHGFVQFPSRDGAFVYRNQVGPVVQIVAPADGATLSGTVTLRATAYDPRSGVSSVSFVFNGIPVGVDTTPDSGDPFSAQDPAVYSVVLDTRRLGNGAHQVVARATDGDAGGDAPPDTADSAPRSVTIENPLTAPGPLFASDAVATETDRGTAPLRFFVTLPRAVAQTVTVDYKTEDRGAKAPGDYTRTAGKLTFSPGETSKTVDVPVRGDVRRENTERLGLRLSNATGIEIGDAEGVGVIIDDDGPPVSPFARAPRLTLSVTPRRDRTRPFRFVTKGRLKRPAGVVAAKGCRGRVLVLVQVVRKTISARRVKVDKRCRYSQRLRFRSAKRFAKAGRLRVRAQYLGTPFLKKASSRTVTVRTTK